MQMLLEAGANTRAMDINGCAPIQYLLKVTDVRPMAIPELCYQLLLNYNAARVYPPQFHKVLQSCHDYPRALEILINSYERLKPTNKWRDAIPDDCYKRHKDFYDSVFAVCTNTPRSLLHLTRCAIRGSLGGFCHSRRCLTLQRILIYLATSPNGHSHDTPALNKHLTEHSTTSACFSSGPHT
ncbi:hypothetical protein INR49_023615 [Caranx melampygus]|nr:hypothetical protein INR49_023615 [Caranx melampygus]